MRGFRTNMVGGSKRKLIIYDNGVYDSEFFPPALSFIASGYTGTSGTITNNATNFVIKSGSGSWATARTKAKVDLTGFKKVYFTIGHNADVNYTYQSSVCVFESAETRSDFTKIKNTSVTGSLSSETLEIDISDLSGYYYIGVSSADGNRSTTAYKIWLE